MTGMRSWISVTSSFESVVMMATSESIRPKRVFPVLPNAGDAERHAILHGNRVGLLCFLTLDRLPLKEPVHRHNAAALAIRLAERGQILHGLALGVYRLSAAVWIVAPIRDQVPPERV